MSRYGPFGNRGARRTLVTLQRPVVTQEADGKGGYVENWVDLSPSQQWAAVKSGGGNEAVAGNTVRASVTHDVEMDYHPQLTHKCRLVLNGDRFLYVVGIENVDELNTMHKVSCEERS